MATTADTTLLPSNEGAPADSLHKSVTLAAKGQFALRQILPHDFPAYERIGDAAFASSLNATFYPNGKTEQDRVWARRMFDLHRTRDAHYMTYLVTVDKAARPLEADLVSLTTEERARAIAEGRVVGFSVWKIRPEDRATEALEEESRSAECDGLPPSVDRTILEAFSSAIGEGKRRHLGGRRHILLHLLAVDPEYHRKGIGGMHMAWGMATADQLGLMGYLEGSDEGLGLYERWGFKSVEPLGFDARKYGAESDLVHTIMIRPPMTRLSRG